jgi:hypothetical protein
MNVIGSVEWCRFPKLGVPAVKARVDSGAKTSRRRLTTSVFNPFAPPRMRYSPWDRVKKAVVCRYQ